MLIERITKDEIALAKKINGKSKDDTINLRKDFVNKNFIFPKIKGKSCVLMLNTQWGKSYVNKAIIDYILKNNEKAKIIFVFPEIRLKESMELFLNDERVLCCLPTMAVKQTDTYDYLFIDEGQYFLHHDTRINSQVMNIKHKRCYVNAAFLEDVHIKFLAEYNINYAYQIKEDDELDLGTKTLCHIYNVPILFSEAEEKELRKTQAIGQHYLSQIEIHPEINRKASFLLMSCLNNQSIAEHISKLMKWQVPQVVGLARQYINFVQKRKSLYKNAVNKLDTCLKIINTHPDERAIIYVGFNKTAESVKKMLTKAKLKSDIYTAKTGEYVLENFRKKEIQFIIIINKGTVGVIDADIQYAIHLAYEAKPLRAMQKKARVQTVNPDDPEHEPTNYYLYVDCPNSQEYKWLKTAQANMISQTLII